MVITISHRYGCGAASLARVAAERLGFEFVDEQLPVVVASRLRTTTEAVEAAEDMDLTMSERMLRGLELGTPEVRAEPGPSFDEQCLREVQEAVREYAAHDNVVIIGRGAHAILGRGPNILRVFMTAPREWRIQRVMHAGAYNEKRAAEELDRVDRARREYLRAYYDIEWGDPDTYDLVLDTSTFDSEVAVQIIVDAAAPR